MAQTEHLPLYKASYDLCLYLEEVVAKFVARSPVRPWFESLCAVGRSRPDLVRRRRWPIPAHHAASARLSRSISRSHARSWFQLGTIGDIDSRCPDADYTSGGCRSHGHPATVAS